MIEPIQSDSLRDVFIRKFERLIFSGYFKIGERLPPERDLARQMGVSRPVVHEGLVNLVSKGLVTMTPRRGSVINDYRKQGSLFVLTALFEYGNGQVSENLLNSMLDMRMLFEVENAGLAAKNRSGAQMDQFYEILDLERQADPDNPTQMADLDFTFHHLVSIASDNLVYPLLLNSLRQFYTSLTQKFFSNGSVIPWVLAHHGKLVHAIGDQQPETARQYMEKIVLHGEKHLRRSLDK
ncbi:MAG: FadR family transcriptional regulator [Proteobacteria bacterium]|nr:FadR family transcriptional regulator [Pseudomonadota bacterium]